MNSLFIATSLSIVIIILLIYKIIKDKKNEIVAHKVSHENFLQSQEILSLKNEINILKHKELILYLIAEMLHNKEDRDNTYTVDEVNNILSKARVFTPYYGAEYADINQMTKFIEYLSNELWIKIFKKPAKETDFKVKEWFISDREALNHPSVNFQQ